MGDVGVHEARQVSNTAVFLYDGITNYLAISLVNGYLYSLELLSEQFWVKGETDEGTIGEIGTLYKIMVRCSLLQLYF